MFECAAALAWKEDGFDKNTKVVDSKIFNQWVPYASAAVINYAKCALLEENLQDVISSSFVDSYRISGSKSREIKTNIY